MESPHQESLQSEFSLDCQVLLLLGEAGPLGSAAGRCWEIRQVAGSKPPFLTLSFSHEYLVPARHHSDLWGEGIPPLVWKEMGRGSGEESGRPEGRGDQDGHSNKPIV